MAVRDFPFWLRGALFESDSVQNLLSSIFDRQSIDLQQELTSVASGDEILIFDVSETGQVKTKKATVANIGAAILAGASFASLTVTGLIDISAAGAGQIKFPATQNPSSDANTMDDYEEGTWTPVDASGAGLTFSNAAGNYRKIGGMAVCVGRCDYPATASGAGAIVGGLPFMSNAGANNYGVTTYSTATTALRCAADNGVAQLRFYDSAGSPLTNLALSGAVNIFEVGLFTP